MTFTPIDQIDGALNALVALYTGLDAIISRSVSIGVVNHTDFTLSLSGTSFAHGGLDPNSDLPLDSFRRVGPINSAQ